VVTLHLRPSFTKDLMALKRGHTQNYRRVSEILVDLQTGSRVTITRRQDSRIPNCVKYELADGYRAVLQQVEGTDVFVALAVGTHDHVEAFLDGHKGWVFDPVTGRMRELRLATADENAVDVGPSQHLQPDSARSFAGVVENNNAGEVERSLFDEFREDMLARIEVPPSYVQSLRAITDANSPKLMEVLGTLEDERAGAAALLLAFATGSTDERANVLAIARGEREFRPSLNAADEAVIRDATDEFLCLDDPSGLEEFLEAGRFEQWQLFLHPDQHRLVGRSFDGPARLRGISGSGKTVVALHRARHLAKDALGNELVLFTTFNKALARSAGNLLDALCGPERSRISVTHLHRWCLDFIEFRGLKRPQFNPDALRAARAALRPVLTRLLPGISEEYVWDEVQFLMGRFLHEERQSYLSTDRTGRGRALPLEQRQGILQMYEAYIGRLSTKGYTDPAEFVRIAYRLRRQGEEPERSYHAVIVDEVQDLSEIGLKLLHSLVGNRRDGLLLVGDGTQRIFTRGYSLRGVGIEIGGRSIILRKNYRNTRQILEAAFPLIAEHWKGEIQGAGGDENLAEPVLSAREGPRPALVKCKNVANEGRFLGNEIRYLLKAERCQPREICVMARNDHYRQTALRALDVAGIQAIHYQADAGDPLGNPDKVRVSSIHSAKGHEYVAVFLCGMLEGVFPQRNPTDEELDEERTVLYVGMTRARDHLYLSYSELDNSGQPLERSRFLGDIAANCDELLFP
jgi:superfamily I DNA/RNA helicase